MNNYNRNPTTSSVACDAFRVLLSRDLACCSSDLGESKSVARALGKSLGSSGKSDSNALRRKPADEFHKLSPVGSKTPLIFHTIASKTDVFLRVIFYRN